MLAGPAADPTGRRMEGFPKRSPRIHDGRWPSGFPDISYLVDQQVLSQDWCPADIDTFIETYLRQPDDLR